MLKPISADTSASRFNALVVGAPGVGKTSLLRSLNGQAYDAQSGAWVDSGNAPEPVCVLSAESGLLCVRDLVAAGRIVGYEIETMQDFIDAQRMCLGAEFRNAGFKWVFIDSLTEIASRCAEDMQARYPSKADSFKMWGEYSRVMTDVIKAFRDMRDVNVVFTALETVEKDANGSTGRPIVDIAGSSLKTRLPAYFDLVLHMERVRDGGGQYQTVFSTRLPIGLAKDRSGKLSEYEAPDLLSIKSKLLG